MEDDCKPEFILRKSLSRFGDIRVCPTVYVQAVVNAHLHEILMQNFAHETLLQKPMLFGSLPTRMHRDNSGLPVNTHLINFLQGGDTVVITVGSLLTGYSFRASSIWDAIAFEQFAANAFRRFETICEHAGAYVSGDVSRF